MSQNKFDRDSISILHTDKYTVEQINESNGLGGLLEQIADYELILTANNVLAIKIPLGDNGMLVAINTLDEEAVKSIKVDNAVKADNATNAVKADNATKADEATKATKDGNDNVISETYATKAEVQSHHKIFYGTVNPDVDDTAKANAKQGDIYIQHE